MGQRHFHPQHKELLKEAAGIAEEVTFDFFKLSPTHWRRSRYDILTLEGLSQEEISSHAHALVAKYKGCPPTPPWSRDFSTFTGSVCRITISSRPWN